MAKDPMPKDTKEDPTTAAATAPSRDAGDAGTQAAKAGATLEPGTVLKDDGDYEEVVVRRRKAAKPTGKYLALGNYRFSTDDESTATKLQKQGAHVSRHRYDKDHELAGKSTWHVLLPAPAANGAPKAFDLPEEVAAHALAAHAITEELR